MKYSLEEIARITGGRVVRNSPGIVITGVAGLENAREGDLSFAKTPANFHKVLTSRATAFLLPQPIEELDKAQIIADRPFFAMARLLEVLANERTHRNSGLSGKAFIHPDTNIAPDVIVGPGSAVEEGVTIGAGTVIYPCVFVGKNSRIGENCTVHPNVTIMEEVTIGDRVIVLANSVLGSEGFSVQPGPEGDLVKIPQAGKVIVEDDVEIGANCTVDRATLDSTVIGHSTKIDNHCHIAHNVRIGHNCILVAYAKIAGSTRIGNYVTIAEDVGITDNVTIGDRVRIGGGSRVYQSVAAGMEVWGSPAKPLGQEKRLQAILKRLPGLWEKLRKLLK
jgi:UDP-3-O-[3-hydroxymyristoyl] glucosamine N-acyltransferase